MLPPIAFSTKAQRTDDPPINYLIAAAKANPQLISFAAGLVNPMTLPTEQVSQIASDLLADPIRGREVLQYGTTIGDRLFREAIINHLESIENVPAASMSITPEHVILTTGSQQALYILADILIDPGDIVILESPSYFVYAGALASFGAKIMSVPMDRDGMVVEELDKLLHRLESQGQLSRVKAIYCQSYFQNPTGLTLSRDRRWRLVEIARKFSKRHRILVIEDAAYRELIYDGESLPSLKRFDPDNTQVASCYTFDKPFAAGLKTGYVVLPADVARELAEQKGSHDFGSSHFTQAICHQALIGGQYASHLQTVRDGYRQKRDTMLASLKAHMPDDAQLHWTHPNGGLYTWLSLPRAINTSRTGGLFDACLNAGVIYVPGEYCFHPDESGQVPQNHMRLSFSVTPIEQIEPGVRLLARVIGDALAKQSNVRKQGGVASAAVA
jgi:2-aminoadipate transaminase